MEDNLIISTNNIQSRIYTVRGLQVMLDKDLADLYEVKIKRLNEQVSRNIERFPLEFMFKLSELEFNSLRSQFATLNKGRGTHRKYLPYAFTEQGVAMLSGVLNSNTAIRVSIQIMNTFVSMRKFLTENATVFQRLDTIEKKQIECDTKFEEVFDAIQSRDLKSEKGIFFDGQVFDAYRLVSNIIRTASKSIILIDNYIDDSVLTLLSKRNKHVQVTIFTKEISKQLLLDLAKYHSQYPSIEIKEFTQSHTVLLSSIIEKSTILEHH